MTDRITNADLIAVVNRINRTAGTPERSYTQDAITGKMMANVGNYHLDSAYGGVKLDQMVSEGGGVRSISTSGFTTKRNLYNEMQSFLRGLEACK